MRVKSSLFLDEDLVATHRVVEVVPDEEDSTVIRFKTKGDANDAVDGSLAHYKNVIGTPVFSIPYLGYVANYIQNPPGVRRPPGSGKVIAESKGVHREVESEGSWIWGTY